MSVRIQLHRPHSSFTNLDEIEGCVFLSLVSQETIAAITVKLEGESRSRLAGISGGASYDPYRRDQTQLEVHKVGELIALCVTSSSMIDEEAATVQDPYRISEPRCDEDGLKESVYPITRPI